MNVYQKVSIKYIQSFTMFWKLIFRARYGSLGLCVQSRSLWIVCDCLNHLNYNNYVTSKCIGLFHTKTGEERRK